MSWVVQTRNGSGWVTQDLLSGSLDMDASRYPRTSLTCQVVPDDTVPLEQTPYGTRLRALLDGVPVFTGSVERTTLQRPQGSLQLEAFDITARMRFVKRAEDFFDAILGTPSTATVAEAVALIYSHYGIAVPTISGGEFGDVDLAGFDFAGMLGWEAIEEITDSEGAEAFADQRGGITIRRNPTIKAAPPWQEFTVGEDGTLVSYEVVMDRRTNEVLATVTYPDPAAENEEGSRVGVWRDNSALTGVGTVGPITSTFSVRKGAAWRDKPQADLDAIAAGIADRVRGYARTVTITALPVILLPGETIRVRFLNSAVEKYLVQSVSWPLDGSPMTVTAVNPNPGSI